ncbi:MAG: hypothetical protein ABI807_07070 [Sporichthyaceae bacterium]
MEITKRSWNFWWLFTLEHWLGLSWILYGGRALFLLLAILPFVDRNPDRHWRRRPVAIVLGLIILLAVVALTILMGPTVTKTHLRFGNLAGASRRPSRLRARVLALGVRCRAGDQRRR